MVSALQAAGIDYMITGSTASSLQGEPRSTHDLDLVVAIHPGHLPTLAAAFPAPEFYLDEEDAAAAIARRGMFNLIHGRRRRTRSWPSSNGKTPFGNDSATRPTWADSPGGVDGSSQGRRPS